MKHPPLTASLVFFFLAGMFLWCLAAVLGISMPQWVLEKTVESTLFPMHIIVGMTLTGCLAYGILFLGYVLCVPKWK